MIGIVEGEDLPAKLSLNRLGEQLVALAGGEHIGFRADYNEERELVAIAYECLADEPSFSEEQVRNVIRNHTCLDTETEEAKAAAIGKGGEEK